MRFGLLLAVALVIGGCAQTHYEKPGGTGADFERDKLECDYEAQKATPDGPVHDMGVRIMRRVELLKKCLQIRGWRETKQG